VGDAERHRATGVLAANLQGWLCHAVQLRAARPQPAKARRGVARRLAHALRAVLVCRQDGRAGWVPVHHCAAAHRLDGCWV